MKKICLEWDSGIETDAVTQAAQRVNWEDRENDENVVNKLRDDRAILINRFDELEFHNTLNSWPKYSGEDR